MSGKSKNSSRKGLNRPFDPKVLRRAEEIAKAYQIILHYEGEEYFGRGLEMPYVMADGPTPDACVSETRRALVTAVAHMLESGDAPPSPALDGKRTEQINIRVTPEEKLLLEETARNKGFRGVSDFLRSSSLSSTK